MACKGVLLPNADCEAGVCKARHSGAASSPAHRLIENGGFAARPQCGR
tara:strand:+ start:373 stop:516 length:144 start_codon:yes stop_codon:yes gene_type:complete